jgi:hypothetical protein
LFLSNLDFMYKLLIFLFSLLCITASAQVQLGLSGGISIYSGDLSPKEIGLYFDDVKPMFGVFGRFKAADFADIRLGVSRAEVFSNDKRAGAQTSSLHFRSAITEFSLITEIVPLKLGSYRASVVTAPYLFAGIAAYQFNPQALFDNNWIDLQPIGTEGQGLPNYAKAYNLTQIAIPAGLGIKWIFNRSVTIGLEFGIRKLFNDYLDDISGANLNYLDILNGKGPLAAELSNPGLQEPADINYRRGGDKMDSYSFGGIHVAFMLQSTAGRSGRGLGCPTF